MSAPTGFSFGGFECRPELIANNATVGGGEASEFVAMLVMAARSDNTRLTQSREGAPTQSTAAEVSYSLQKVGIDGALLGVGGFWQESQRAAKEREAQQVPMA